jgi:hypothetical protein
MPEYVTPIKIAKYFGISPLEVIQWPQYFIAATNNVITAENNAQEKMRKREEAKAKRKRGT